MLKKNSNIFSYVLILVSLLWSVQYSRADHSQVYTEGDIHTLKELKDAGKISSLEKILKELSSHDINRILEVQLKREHKGEQEHRFVYEIEYINDKGVVVEIEIDALTTEVLNTENEQDITDEY